MATDVFDQRKCTGTIEVSNEEVDVEEGNDEVRLGLIKYRGFLHPKSDKRQQADTTQSYMSTGLLHHLRHLRALDR